jgi:hypothetical protein
MSDCLSAAACRFRDRLAAFSELARLRRLGQTEVNVWSDSGCQTASNLPFACLASTQHQPSILPCFTRCNVFVFPKSGIPR